MTCERLHFCMQRDGRDTARRAGPSAAADTSIAHTSIGFNSIGSICRGVVVLLLVQSIYSNRNKSNQWSLSI